MELIHLNPYVRYAKLHKNVILEPMTRLCYDCRLFFMVNGTGDILIGDRTHTFSSGSVIFLPPGTEYAYHMHNTPSTYYVLNFDLSGTHSDIEASLGTPFLPLSDRSKILTEDAPEEFAQPFIFNDLVFPQQIITICQLFSGKEHFYKEKSSALLKFCLLDIVQQAPKDTGSVLTLQILDYIYANYSTMGLTNQSIAEHFGYHPYYMNEIVKKVSGKTLHQHLIEHRIMVAADLLIATDYDVNTIAWKTGFGSASSFIKMFRMKTGMTPMAYRRLR